jgi:hypothetical protein
VRPTLVTEEARLSLKLGFGGAAVLGAGIGGWLGLGVNLSLNDFDIFVVQERYFYVATGACGGRGVSIEGPSLNWGALKDGSSRQTEFNFSIGDGLAVDVSVPMDVSKMRDNSSVAVQVGAGGVAGVRVHDTEVHSVSGVAGRYLTGLTSQLRDMMAH